MIVSGAFLYIKLNNQIKVIIKHALNTNRKPDKIRRCIDMVSFDYINDIHIDFWVRYGSNQLESEIQTREFVSKVIETKKSDYLLIGGDIGHYNKQNYWFLEELSKFYKGIYLVFGNHDLYLISGSQKKLYKNNSLNRLNDMKSLIDELENVFYLDGKIIDIGGIKVGGVNMWYDFSYGINQGYTYESIEQKWYLNSNDSNFIKGLDIKEYFKCEKEKLDLIIEESNIILSHVGPDCKLTNLYGKSRYYNSFYFFDGCDIINHYEEKVWLFGHIHSRFDIEHEAWRMISHAIGYSDQGFNVEVKTFSI